MPPTDPASILDLYPPANESDRAALLLFIRETPIAFGTRRHLKGLYKRVEADPVADPIILGALLGRLDDTHFAPAHAPAIADLGELRHVASLDVRNKKAYLLAGRWAGAADQLAVYDLDSVDPLKPKPPGRVRVENARHVVLCGPSACVLSGGHNKVTLNVYDIATAPEQPVHRGRVDLSEAYASVDYVFPYAFAVVQEQPRRNKFDGLRVVGLSDPDRPVVVGEVEIKEALGVAVSPDRTLACVQVHARGFSWTSLPRGGGIRVVDVADPARPKVVGSLDLDHISSLAFAGHHLYVGVGQNGPGQPAGLHVIDLSDPGHPRKVRFVPTEGWAPTTISVRERYAYVASPYGNTLIFDVHDPAAPEQAGSQNGLTTFASDDGILGYEPKGYDGLAVWNVSNPVRPFRVGVPPRRETIGYMKRRARRALRSLAGRDPDRYVEAACQMLQASGHKTNEVDGHRQWASIDVLFGGSDRWVQQSHGRGAYVARHDNPRPYLRTRFERAPAAWDRRPDLAATLLTTPDLPWQTYEFAAKVLRAANATLPDIPAAALATFLVARSPLLVSLATRRIAAKMASRQTVNPVVAADAFLLSGRARRRSIEGGLAGHDGGGSGWAEKFALRIVTQTGETLTGGRMTRRQSGAIALLARALPERVPPEALLPFLAPVLRERRDVLTQWLHAALRRMPMFAAFPALLALDPLPDDLKDAALDALTHGLGDKRLDLKVARDGIEHSSLWIQAATWRLLAAGAADEVTASVLWRALLDLSQETPALRTAMASSDALALLARSDIGAGEIAVRLGDRPFLVGLLSPETFATITQTVPASVTLRLIAAAPDALWTRLRPAWLRNLREGIGVNDLWTSAEAAFANDIDDRLDQRLLQDNDIAETILGVEDVAAILAIREPAFGPLLGRYVRRHANQFVRDSDLLLEAATHVLPDIRDWALVRVGEVGMNLPFALRLLEAELPASVAAGKAFFEAADQHDRAFDYALALCDSPQRSVRAYGRAYVTARWDILPRADLYRALFENPDPEMQAWVASLLRDEKEPPLETIAFDREVLRARGRGRRAKEQVKARQTETPTVDVETLLALARGGSTPRDAEWALGQLARLALGGQPIEGFTIDGVAGG